MTISFDPARAVSVRGSRAVLGSSSFTDASLSTACSAARAPRAYGGELGGEIVRVVRARCTVPTVVRLHVNPIVEGGKVVGSNLLVGTTGARMNVIASAVLKNQGDPDASRLYLARRFCRRV